MTLLVAAPSFVSYIVQSRFLKSPVASLVLSRELRSLIQLSSSALLGGNLSDLRTITLIQGRGNVCLELLRKRFFLTLIALVIWQSRGDDCPVLDHKGETTLQVDQPCFVVS